MKSAHLNRAPTRPQPANAGSASRNTRGGISLAPPLSARPRRSICRFAAIGLSAIPRGKSRTLCACAAGLISVSTVSYSVARIGQECQYRSCFFLVFHPRKNGAPIPGLRISFNCAFTPPQGRAQERARWAPGLPPSHPDRRGRPATSRRCGCSGADTRHCS